MDIMNIDYLICRGTFTAAKNIPSSSVCVNVIVVFKHIRYNQTSFKLPLNGWSESGLLLQVVYVIM